MLAAVLGLPPSASRERLESIGRSAGFSAGRELVTESGVAMVWPGLQTTAVDTAAHCAWLGTPRGRLPPPESDDFTAVTGDYCLVALRRSHAVLARGRFGGRPLYYARSRSGETVVCSRLAPLLAVGEGAAALDCRGLSAAILTATFAEFDRTVYEGIRRVPSGDVVLITAFGIRSLPRRPIPSPPDVKTAQEAAEELRTRMIRVVARATNGAQRVAVLAGGGVDSSAVLAATLAVVRGAPPRQAIAIALDVGGEGDDRPHLRALSHSLGIEPVRLGPEDFAFGGAPQIAIDGGPFPWPTADSNISLVRKAHALGADLVLTGVLGDEVFGGDTRTFAALAMDREPIRGLLGAATLQGTWLPSIGARLSTLFVRPLVNSVCSSPSEVWRRLRRRRAPSWMGPVLRGMRESWRADVGRDSIADILSGHARHRALDSPLYHLDQSDYRAQLELISGCARVDRFLDEEIVDFVGALPAPFLFHGGFHRGLLREAMRGLVPDTVRLRPDKATATTMMQEIFRAPGRAESIQPLLSMRVLGALGLVEPRRFSEAFEKFRTTMSNPKDWIDLWPVVVAEGFARGVVEGPGWSAESPHA